MAPLSPNRAMMPVAQQLDALLRGFEEWFRRTATPENATQESPMPSSPFVERRRAATIVGTLTEDESTRAEDSPSKGAASGAANK